jgi:hypothetical protein
MSDVSVANGSDLESLVARVADEFQERLKRGERPGVEEYAARHPEAADLLRKVLAALEVVGLSAVGAAAPAEGSAPETLGDFRLLREVGRGGMGVVYEAEQVSLGRRVALKVLPFAATMDPKQLHRFQNEARAAAGLHHTNIVPVHAVGCERGVHYYAMQYIDGRSLAEVLDELRRLAGSGRGSSDSPVPLSEAAAALVRGQAAPAPLPAADQHTTAGAPPSPDGVSSSDTGPEAAATT